MEFYYLSNNSHKTFNTNKNDINYPNQLRNYNHNSNPVVPISPIKSQNYNKFKFNIEKDIFYDIKRNIDSNNNFLINKNNVKNISVDYDKRSLNFNNDNNTQKKEKLKNSHSYSNIIQDNKNYKDLRQSSNLFEYSNNNNVNFNMKSNNNFYFNNQINNNINRDNFWINDNKTNNNNNINDIMRNRSSSFFGDKNRTNNNNQNEYNNSAYRNNYILNENNKSFNNYKFVNTNNYRYLFDYPGYNSNNNINFSNKDSNDNSSNNLSLHDKYISPDYIDALKSKNFYSSNNNDEKYQFFFKSLNKFQTYFNNNNQNIINPQIKRISNKNKNKINNTPIKINTNKNDKNNKESLLNYILHNSEIFKKIIDNSLLKKNNINGNLNNNINNISNNNNNLSLKYFLPQKSNSNTNKKTLILDLDETLVHSSFKPLAIKSDINFNIYFQNKPYMINVLIRPYAQEFLEKMSKIYEIAIFTASVPQYANPLLDILDKNKNIEYRLYRQHCVSLYGLFIKDLRKIGRDIKNTIILDNNPISYLLNQDNGLPIKTWHFDKNDKELIKIIPLLEYLSRNEINDVREIISKIVVNNNIDYNRVKSIINNNNINTNKNIDKNKKNFVRANSFNYLTPKKDNNILINNYYKNESYNKKDNNNININIINFNISKVIMNNDLKNNKNLYNIKNIPISSKTKRIHNKNQNKNKIDYFQRINNIYSSKNKKSKENIESLINSKYKYLGHLINDKKQHKNNKIYRKDIGINKPLLNYKRQLSQTNLLSSSNKKSKNDNNIKSKFHVENYSQNRKYDIKDYNDIIYKYQINQNLKSLYDNPIRKTESNINTKQNINYLYNNLIGYDINYNPNSDMYNNFNLNNLSKNNFLFNNVNKNNSNSNERIIYNKINKRASTPSVSHHIKKNTKDLYKEYNINYNNKYLYKYN